MNTPLFIARRYINSRRGGSFLSLLTIFSIVGITIGVAALIITLSIINGFEKEIREKIIGFNAHVQILGFQGQPLPHFTEVEEKIRKDFPEVRTLIPFVAREAMLRCRQEVDGIFLKGVEPTAELSIIRNHIVEGDFDLGSGNGPPLIIIGKKLARKMNIHLGDMVVAFALSGKLESATQTQIRAFRVSAIYETGMAEFDDIFVYTHIQQAQKLFDLSNSVLGIDIFLNDANLANDVTSRLADELPYPYYPQSVFRQFRNLFSWVELQKKPAPIILGLIIAVAVVNIIGTLLMLVLEKTGRSVS